MAFEKQYKPWCQLVIHHNYYQNGSVPGLRIEPSPYSQVLLQQFDIKLAKQANGIKLYRGFTKHSGTTSKEETEQVNVPLVLNFGVYFEAPSIQANFFNYTDLPMTRDEHRGYFFTNSISAESTWTEEQKNLSKVQYVSPDDLRTGSLGALAFELPPKRPLKAILSNAAGQVVHQVKLTKKTNPSPNYIIDIRDQDWGEYKLAITSHSLDQNTESSILIEEQFCRLPESSDTLCWGSIQLKFATISVEQEQAGTTILPSYELRFQNRHTQWRYNIINHNGLKFDQFKVTKNRETIAFTQATNRHLADGTPVQTLTLEPRLPLLEKQTEKLQLELLQNGTTKDQNTETRVSTVATIPLPTPTPEQLRLGRQQGELVTFSDMYVYI